MKTFKRDDRKTSPWGVTFSDENGQRVRRFFKTEGARREFVRAQQLDLFDEAFSVEEWNRWLKLKAECARAAVAPEDLLTQLGEIVPQAPYTLAEAIQDYHADLDARKLPKSSQYHWRLSLARFMAYLGGSTRLTAITKDNLQGWLRSFTEVKPRTLHHYHKYLGAFFRFHKDGGRIRACPTDNIRLPRIVNAEPQIIPVDDLRQFFAANIQHDPGLCALMALGAFAGLRMSSIYRLELKDINFEDQTILLPGEKLKTDRRHLVEGMPGNLWPWLALLEKRDLNYPKTEPEYNKKKRAFEYRRYKACQRARLTLTANGLRHSFVTYLSVLKGSADAAASIVGHKDARMTWDHYKGIASIAAAKAYFESLPNWNTDLKIVAG